MAGSHTPTSARDTSVDSSPLTLVSTVEHGLSARLAGRVDGYLAAFAEHMREGLLAASTGTISKRPSPGSSPRRCSRRVSPGSVFGAIDHLPRRLALAGRGRLAPLLVDLVEPVDPEIDHVRGPADGQVTLVEHGDLDARTAGRPNR
jgi:hypothetical protein